MNLESRMREKSRECHILTDGLEHERIELRLSLDDALTIAREDKLNMLRELQNTYGDEIADRIEALIKKLASEVQ